MAENEKSNTEESVKRILRSVEVDCTVDITFDNEQPSSLDSPVLREKSMNRTGSLLRKRAQGTGGPRMGRLQSGAARGLQSLHFLDAKTAANERDTWNAVENWFRKNAGGERLCKDKFGACIGIFLRFFSL